jgi:hypothetical protein
MNAKNLIRTSRGHIKAGSFRGPLSEDVIVDAALHIIDVEGPSQLCMQRVATVVGVESVFLMPYVRNLDKLRELMLDQALGSIELANVGSAGDRLKAFSVSYLNVLRDRPGLAVLVQDVASLAQLKIWYRVVQLFQGAGVGETEAELGADMILMYCTAVSRSHDAGKRDYDLPCNLHARLDRAIDAIIDGMVGVPPAHDVSGRSKTRGQRVSGRP